MLQASERTCLMFLKNHGAWCLSINFQYSVLFSSLHTHLHACQHTYIYIHFFFNLIFPTIDFDHIFSSHNSSRSSPSPCAAEFKIFLVLMNYTKLFQSCLLQTAERKISFLPAIIIVNENCPEIAY